MANSERHLAGIRNKWGGIEIAHLVKYQHAYERGVNVVMVERILVEGEGLGWSSNLRYYAIYSPIYGACRAERGRD
jgi:hypothetical protein